MRGIDLELYHGEVHALLGENGAGKSTLVKILGGVHRPTEGTVVLHGEEVHFHSPSQSQAAGISVVHQEPALFPDLDVAENIYLGRHPRRGGRIDWKQVLYAERGQPPEAARRVAGRPGQGRDPVRRRAADHRDR